MSQDESATASGFKFDYRISLGNLLSGGLMLASVLLWGARMEGLINSESTLRTEQAKNTELRFAGIQEEYRTQILQLQRDSDKTDQTRRSEMRDIKDTLSRIELKIDTKADKK